MEENKNNNPAAPENKAVNSPEQQAAPARRPAIARDGGAAAEAASVKKTPDQNPYGVNEGSPYGSAAFSRAYSQQKQERQAELAVAKQTQADSALKAQNPQSKTVTVLRNQPAPEKSPAKKKEDAIFITLLVLTIALFLVSVAYLFLHRGNVRTTVNTIRDTAQSEGLAAYTQGAVSTLMTSPFTSRDPGYKIQFPEGIQEKYKAAYAQNSDFAGWLTVPGTCIDFPVYYNGDNDYYLRHDNYGMYTKYGIPYLDADCDVKNLSKNNTIYGHNFDNKLIFDELHNYTDLNFYKANPVLTFNTIYADHKWKIFAAFRSNGDSNGDNGYLFYYPSANMSDSSFMSFYDEIMQRSYLKTTVDVQPTDKFVTLSTCTYFFDRNGYTQNARFVVMARMVRDGESEGVDTSGASVTDKVRYPQLYYDVFGGSNPYVNASHWEAS